MSPLAEGGADIDRAPNYEELRDECEQLRRILLARDLECVRLRAGLRAALEIAWRRGRNEWPPTDGDRLAELEGLLK